MDTTQGGTLSRLTRLTEELANNVRLPGLISSVERQLAFQSKLVEEAAFQSLKPLTILYSSEQHNDSGAIIENMSKAVKTTHLPLYSVDLSGTNASDEDILALLQTVRMAQSVTGLTWCHTLSHDLYQRTNTSTYKARK